MRDTLRGKASAKARTQLLESQSLERMRMVNLGSLGYHIAYISVIVTSIPFVVAYVKGRRMQKNLRKTKE